MGSSKPLLVPWLKEQISSNKYPGLCWINPECTQFCIPWKHGLRQDLSDDDCKIFEAWAIASGRYRPSVDKRDPSVWKRNLRCALNKKKQFKLIQDRSNDSDNPHKIYEICSNFSSTSSQDADEEDTEGESPLSDCSLLAPLYPTSATPQYPLDEHMNSLTMSDQVVPYSPSQGFSELEPIPPSYDQLSPSRLLQEGAMAASPLPEEPISNLDISEQQVMNMFPNSQFESQFLISVFYRGKKVKEATVTNTQGFRIFFNYADPITEHLEQFSLPDTSLLTDQRQINYISRLLEKVRQGLTLEVRQNCIYAQRLGSCKVFWNLSKYPTNKIPQEVGKMEPTMLYNIRQFVSELIGFMQHERGSPEYSIWLCFGERWPEDSKPWEKMLIMVQVTPIAFQMLHEMAQVWGASSLHSEEVNLQISDSLSSSSFLSMLQELELRMDF